MAAMTVRSDSRIECVNLFGAWYWTETRPAGCGPGSTRATAPSPNCQRVSVTR